MRMFNNYSNGSTTDTRINEIRSLTNEYGIRENIKETYNEEKIIKTTCHNCKDKHK